MYHFIDNLSLTGRQKRKAWFFGQPLYILFLASQVTRPKQVPRASIEQYPSGILNCENIRLLNSQIFYWKKAEKILTASDSGQQRNLLALFCGQIWNDRDAHQQYFKINFEIVI